MGVLLRRAAFAGIEALVRSSARRALDVSRRFGDDALGYFTERLDPAVTRQATVTAVRHAQRNKAFDDCPFIGLALDGTAAGRSHQKVCAGCRPYRNPQREIVGYHHQLVMISVVGTGLTLPLDVEPYGPGESEYHAGRRLLRRALGNLGPRFADYVVVDGEFATAPFLHAAGDLGLPVVARLKDNLPELLAAAQKRFRHQPPQQVFSHGKDRVEIWDADDFDPWETLRWKTVRVIRYRQHKPNGTVFEAYWLTDFPRQQVSSRALFRMAKSRWEVENQGFNDAKNLYGFEHICHHERSQPAGGLAAHRLSLDHRTPLPNSLPSPRHPPHPSRHHPLATPLAQLVLANPRRLQLAFASPSRSAPNSLPPRHPSRRGEVSLKIPPTRARLAHNPPNGVISACPAPLARKHTEAAESESGRLLIDRHGRRLSRRGMEPQ